MDNIYKDIFLSLVINRFVTIIIANIIMNDYTSKCRHMTSVVEKEKCQVPAMKSAWPNE